MKSRSTSSSAKPAPRNRLPAKKGSELIGLMLLTLALLLGISLFSYHPQDPSLFHQTLTDPSQSHNLIGPFGAQLAAVSFGLLGVTCLLVPLLLLVLAWRRLRQTSGPKVVGRGLGGLLVLASLPALLQLTLDRISWRGELLDPGGVIGLFLADSLQTRVGFTGSLLVLLAVVVTGFTLLVQSTLGELLAQWNNRLRELWQRLALARARHNERRERERARRRVLAKHLQRASEDRSERPRVDLPTAASPSAPEMPPLRVVERQGERDYAVRRVRAASTPTGEPVPEKPQKHLPFSPAPSIASLPPLDLLRADEERPSVQEDNLVRLGDLICKRCTEFGVEGSIEGISPGPVITVFEFQPAPGIKVSQIVALQDDLALALKAESVRIDRLPGRSTLGIEVPNTERSTLRLGGLLRDETFRRAPSVLTMAIGQTIHGKPYYADLAGMPHLLVAGATGAGKSVGLQSMITSILYKASREQVQFIFIDPKRIELGVYADIPHLKTEVVVEPKKAANALRWAVAEMERRYRLLADVHVRSIDYYNRAIRDPETQRRLALREGEEELGVEDLKPLPYYVVIIDELADLMLIASSEVEAAIARLAQMARAVGIHLIISTQRPSVDVLTGTIKANFPCRISYATASRHDSRTILDQIGAEKLLGRGDMLFMPPGSSRLLRLHGPLISEQETAALVRWLKKQGKPDLDLSVLETPAEETASASGGDADDELFDQAARLVVAERQASASFLQRRMRIGFSRAARLIDMMERDGLLGPQQGSKPREVLVKQDYFDEIDRLRSEP